MIYIDSNVFVIAANPDDSRKEKAGKLLELMENGFVDGATSVITVDEVVYSTGGIAGKEKASDVWDDFLSEPGLELEELDEVDLASAKRHYPRFDPRDAIHLQTFKKTGAEYMVTEDTDFLDEIEKAVNVESFLSQLLEKDVLDREERQEIQGLLD